MINNLAHGSNAYTEMSGRRWTRGRTGAMGREAMKAVGDYIDLRCSQPNDLDKVTVFQIRVADH